MLQQVTTGFSLRAFESTPEADSHYAVLHLFWETSSDACTDADMLLTVQSLGSAPYEVILSPGSRFWPPQSWPPSSIIRDRHRIPVSNITSETSIRVKMLPMTRQRGR